MSTRDHDDIDALASAYVLGTLSSERRREVQDRLPNDAKWLGVKLGLLAGGAIGNMYDRAVYQRVTDFILWKITTASQTYEWPTFNIADAALVIGVAMILIDRPRDPLPPEESEPAKPTDSPAAAAAEKPASA